MRFANITLSDLQFAPVRHAPPQESRIGLIEAWRDYTTTNPFVDTLAMASLNTTYQIGLCRSLSMGRSGVLANPPGEREWARCRPFLTALRAQITAVAATSAKVVLCRVNEIDMIVGTTAWFFVGGDQASELQRLDRLVTILLMVHMARSTHTITHVRLLQLITGFTLEWSVEDWPTASSALLIAFVQARSHWLDNNES
jgi:hypothetical protein